MVWIERTKYRLLKRNLGDTDQLSVNEWSGFINTEKLPGIETRGRT
jgi:hypothetical protein